MFVSHYCTANIITSGQGSIWKVKKVLSLNQVEAPAINLVEARGQSFPAARLTWLIWLDQTIGLKIRSIDVCLKTLQVYGMSKTAISAELCKRSFSAIIHRCYSILNKHLLRKTQNFFCPPCIIKGRSLFLRLLKLAFFARRKSQSAFNNFVYSVRFRPKVQDLFETIKFVVAQERCNQNWVILMGHIFKTWCEFINKLTFVNAYSICFIQSFDQYFLEWKPFIFEFHWKTLIYVFCSQYCVLSIPHCAGFPVHGWKLLLIMVRYWVSIVLRIG